ncbi:MAG: hypothetical protein LBI89_00630 [Prevotellaceae bacterium]|nr:hypothetical protein [Prevotellaceae bacterium]
MKRFLKNIVALSLGMALATAGFSQDREAGMANAVAGNYQGILSASGAVEQETAIMLAAEGENTVVLSLHATLAGLLPDGADLPLENIACQAVVTEVEKDGEVVYEINGSTTVPVPALGDAPVSFAVKQGHIASGHANIPIVLTFGSLEQTIAIFFMGSKQ